MLPGLDARPLVAYFKNLISSAASVVHTSGDEVINGIKTFVARPIVGTAAPGTSDTAAASTGFVAASILAAVNMPIAVRQSIQCGPITGSPSVSDLIPQSQIGNTLAAGITLKCSTTATLFSVANGFNPDGSPNNINWLATADIVVPNLTGSSTTYIWVDTVARTAGFVVVADDDQNGGTIPITTNKYTFDSGGMKMYLGNGTVASQSNRIIVAEVDTSGTVVTAIRCRAFQGSFDSGWFTVALTASYSKSHLIGTSDILTDIKFNSTATNVGALSVDHYVFSGGSTGAVTQRNKGTVFAFTESSFVYGPGNTQAPTGATTGFYRITGKRRY